MPIRIEDVTGMDFSDVAGTRRIGAVTPGEVLREEFMVPLGLSACALARELGVPSNSITAILAGDRSVTAKTAAGRTVRHRGRILDEPSGDARAGGGAEAHAPRGVRWPW